MENLANCYLREIIKQECWDTMSVKGRSVKVTSMDFFFQLGPVVIKVLK